MDYNAQSLCKLSNLPRDTVIPKPLLRECTRHRCLTLLIFDVFVSPFPLVLAHIFAQLNHHFQYGLPTQQV